MKGRKVYKYRNCLIIPTDDGWLITDYSITCETLNESYNYIDSQLGGWSGKNLPKRWTDDMINKFYL